MKRELNAIAKIDRAFITRFPTGKWGFTGRAPVTLLYVGEESEINRLLSINCGQFLPRRVWATEEEAVAAAKSLGCELA